MTKLRLNQSCVLSTLLYSSECWKMTKSDLNKLSTFHIEMHLTPKYFFRLNESLHLFETHCAFLSLFNPTLDFSHAVKVTKSGQYLFHDRASKGYGSIPGLMSQTSLHACLQWPKTMQISLWRQTRNRSTPLTSSVVVVVTLTAYKKLSFSLKRCSTFRIGARIYLSKKSILGLGTL